MRLDESAVFTTCQKQLINGRTVHYLTVGMCQNALEVSRFAALMTRHLFGLTSSIIYHLILVELKRTVRISQFMWSTGKYALSTRGCRSSRLFGD